MSIADMDALPDISGNDSERLQEFVRITAREVKAVGGASAGTTLEMIGYIRELEHALGSTRAAVAGPRGDEEWRTLIIKKLRELEVKFNWTETGEVITGVRQFVESLAATSSTTPAEPLIQYEEAYKRVCAILVTNHFPIGFTDRQTSERNRRLAAAIADEFSAPRRWEDARVEDLEIGVATERTPVEGTRVCVKCGHSARRWHGFCQARASKDVVSDRVCGCECEIAAAPAKANPQKEGRAVVI